MLGNKKRYVSDHYKEDRPNVWIKFSEAIQGREDMVDLGMGFPSFPTPSILLEELDKIARDPLYHQPPPPRGIPPPLLDAISDLYSPLMGRRITPDQVITGLGAQGVLYLAIRALVGTGDEVILLEPAFECYETQIKACGGVPLFVPFEPPVSNSSSSSADDWRLDPAKLEAAISPRTSLLILNNPNNPLGKSLSREEVEMVARFCCKHKLLVLSDEVYEWMVFDGRAHVRMAALEGMWERTLSIFSAGKLFSATGWRLGWGVGPSELIGRLEEFLLGAGMTGCAPVQHAVAEMLRREAKLSGTADSYLCQLRAELEMKRDRLYSAMKDLGLSPIRCTATYFLLLEVPRIQEIAGIPDRFIRLCFAKQDQTLESAVQRLASLKQRLDDLS